MRYGIHTRLKRGRRISVFFTMRCPLQCSYCSMKALLKPNDPHNELDLDQWKLTLLRLFKFMPIRELYVTGGEPTLRPDISAFINFLLDQGKCVTLHSNLWTENAMAVKQTDKFRIESTYHGKDNYDRYMKTLYKYQLKYRVDVTEIEQNEIIGSHIKPFELHGPEIGGSTDRFAVAPDGSMFVRMSQLYKHMGVK